MATHTASADGRFDVLTATCPTRKVINRLGDRWSLLVIYALEAGTLRFQQLRSAVDGISQKMLTHTLRALEREGLVTRKAYPSVPPRVEYSLSPLGSSLCERIAALRDWTYLHMDEIETARAQYDARSNGHEARTNGHSATRPVLPDQE